MSVESHSDISSTYDFITDIVLLYFGIILQKLVISWNSFLPFMSSKYQQLIIIYTTRYYLMH